VGKINDFNWKEKSYNLVLLAEVRKDQSVNFHKLCLVSIGPVVGEIWGENSLRWDLGFGVEMGYFKWEATLSWS
jgi:hypothetical protein